MDIIFAAQDQNMIALGSKNPAGELFHSFNLFRAQRYNLMYL
jgi:hypothetical protein